MISASHRPKAPVTDEEQPGWLLTYADMVTLLLVFFILLYTLANFEKAGYEEAVESIKVKVETHEEFMNLLELADLAKTRPTPIAIEDVTGLKLRSAELYRKLMGFHKAENMSDTFSINADNQKIIIRLDGGALFESGSASLNTYSAPVFDGIIKILGQYPDYRINIKGHTDDVPISTPVFPSNWELSAIRATTVLKYMIKEGIEPQRLTATGYGDSLPLLPNDSEENRAQNRRVEFVLEKEDNGH